MNIEEIMKPYFDKKEEFSKRHEVFENSQNETINRYEEENKKYREENESYEREIAAINVRLENYRKNRNAEIEEYVKNAVSDRPEFYAGYGAMIRKDLEQEYLNREKALEHQRNEFNDKINNNYLKISENNKLIEKANQTKNVVETNKFYNVDVRELVDIKHDLRKSLISAKKELETKLKEIELRFDAVMYKLSTFKYEYDENHNVLNGNEYRELFEQSNSLIEVKYNLQNNLNKVDEYLKITELTEEEVKVVMMSMSDYEKEEYNRRKCAPSEEIMVEVYEEPEKNVDTEIRLEDNNDSSIKEKIAELDSELNKDKKSSTEQSIYEQAKAAIENEIESEENYSEFIEEITTDVLSCVKSLRTVEVQDGKIVEVIPGKENKEYEILSDQSEQIEVINGLYLNRHDVEKALRNYKKQSKGRTFTVKGIDLALNVTRKSVNKVKDVLRKFSLRDLLNEKKISDFDVRRVYGKDTADEYTYYTVNEESLTDNYVKVKDVYEAFKELFVEKTPTWLERLTSKFIRPELKELDEVPYEDYEETEDTMTWDAKEPEYEVVKAKTK